jgi:hypothetical protein
MNASQQPTETTADLGSTRGRHDFDLPYRFGRTPRAIAPYPFSTRQFARLLVLRGRVRAGQFGGGDLAAARFERTERGAADHGSCSG